MSLSSHIKIIARKTKESIPILKVAEGTLAGWRSLSIAAGSGAGSHRYPYSLE
jgi:hypothetical protein